MSRKKACIDKIQLPDRSVTENIDEIKYEAIRSFEEAFNTEILLGNLEILEVIPKSVSSSYNNALLMAPTLDEVRDVIFQILNDSASSPDTVGTIIKAELFDAFVDFFEGKTIPHAFMSSLIDLIPKVDDPMDLSNYRPISNCNVAYKVITKLIMYRLIKLLPKLIINNQSAFLEGRVISDSILLAQ